MAGHASGRRVVADEVVEDIRGRAAVRTRLHEERALREALEDGRAVRHAECDEELGQDAVEACGDPQHLERVGRLAAEDLLGDVAQQWPFWLADPREGCGAVLRAGGSQRFQDEACHRRPAAGQLQDGVEEVLRGRVQPGEQLGGLGPVEQQRLRRDLDDLALAAQPFDREADGLA